MRSICISVFRFLLNFGSLYFTFLNNKKNISNYVEIFINTDIKTIIKKNKKQLYKKTKEKIWGVNIKAEFPKKPMIEVENDFNKSPKIVADKLLKSIFKIVKY